MPAIATAALATAAGFLVLLLSPVPMVRGFGVLLVVGVGVAFALALTGGTAALVCARRRARAAAARALGGAARASCSPARRGRCARPAAAGARLGGAALRAALARPGRVLAVGLALAAARLGRGHADRGALGPRSSSSRRTCRRCATSTRSSGRPASPARSTSWSRARDLADPKVVAWMRDYQRRVLKDARYSEANGCGRAALCPALSLPDLFQGDAGRRTARRIAALLDAVPPYFSQAVITADRRTANLAFGIRLDAARRAAAR